MRMITDPPPELPMVPAVTTAINAVMAELIAVRREHPEMTVRQRLQEARRRCHKHMIAAADAIEALDRKRHRAQRSVASPNGGAGLSRR